jgi:hypothetical protein
MEAILVDSFTTSADTTDTYIDPSADWYFLTHDEGRVFRPAVIPAEKPRPLKGPPRTPALRRAFDLPASKWMSSAGKVRVGSEYEKALRSQPRWTKPESVVDLSKWAGTGENHTPHRQPLPESKKLIPYKKPIATYLRGITPKQWYIKEWVEQPRPGEELRHRQVFAGWLKWWGYTDRIQGAATGVRGEYEPKKAALLLRSDLLLWKSAATCKGLTAEVGLYESALAIWSATLKEGRRDELDTLYSDPDEALALGFNPSAEVWRVVVIETLDSLASLFYISGLYDGLPAIVRASKSTKLFKDLRYAIEDRSARGEKQQIIAEFYPAAIREVSNLEDPTPRGFRRAVENSITAAAKRGHTGKAIKRRRTSYSMEFQKEVEEGEFKPLHDRLESPEGDPAEILVRRDDVLVVREFVGKVHTLAPEVLTNTGLKVWRAAYQGTGEAEEQDLAVGLSMSKSNFSHIKTRCLERMRDALEARGYDRSILEHLPRGVAAPYGPPDPEKYRGPKPKPQPPKRDPGPTPLITYYLAA